MRRVHPPLVVSGDKPAVFAGYIAFHRGFLTIEVTGVIDVISAHVDSCVHLVQLWSLRDLETIQPVAFLQIITRHDDGNVTCRTGESVIPRFVCPGAECAGCCSVFTNITTQPGKLSCHTAQTIFFDILPPC